MPSISITTTGHGTLTRPAERAILRITVQDVGTDNATVASNVISQTAQVKALLEPHSIKPQSGEPAPFAAITHWSMGALNSYSYPRYNQNGQLMTKQYTASTSFEAKFSEFQILASVAQELAAMDSVNLDGITWRLTDVTRAALAREVRGMAGRDALARAKDYARAFGKERVDVVEVLEDTKGSSASVYRGHAARSLTKGRQDPAEGDPGLSFQPEEVEFGAKVTAKFVTE
ncbi:hypothetical protein BJX76DRAFT_339472 [Aspergillus varians]